MICDRDPSPSSKTQLSTTSPRQHNFTLRHVTCPQKHVTHAFLACDVRSSCWADDDFVITSWGFPWRGTCESSRHYPPSFTCSNAMTRVPYLLVCDHHEDCHDGSDETFCTFPACRDPLSLQCGASPQVWFVCWLAAYRPSNMRVYLRDGFAQTILRAATLR